MKKGTKSPKNGENEQTEILRAIWNEMKALKASLERQLETTRAELGTRIDGTNQRLEGLSIDLRDENDELRKRMVESEMRLATATMQLMGETGKMSTLVREWKAELELDLRRRVARIEEHLHLEPGSGA